MQCGETVSAVLKSVRKISSYVMSVCPHGTTRQPLEGCFRISVERFRFHYNLTRITALYMKTNIYFWSYFAQFFLEWEIFHIKFVEKVKARILCSITIFFFLKPSRLWDNVEKYGTAGQATDENMAHSHRMLDT